MESDPFPARFRQVLPLLEEDLVDQGGRGPLRSRKVDHAHLHLVEARLNLLPLRGLVPVVAHENHVEAHLLPGLELVHGFLSHDHVHESNGPDDLAALGEGNDGLLALRGPQQLIGGHADDEAIAHRPGIAQDVQMSDVKEIKDACGVSDDHSGPSRFECAKFCPRHGTTAPRGPTGLASPFLETSPTMGYSPERETSSSERFPAHPWKRASVQRPLTILALLWLGATCLGFWFWHPGNLTHVLALLRPGGAVLFLALFAMSSFGWGMVILRRLPGPKPPEGFRLLLAMALGWVILAATATGLGFLALLHRELLWGILILGILLARRELLRRPVSPSAFDGFRKAPKSLLFLLGLAAALNLASAMLPPTGHDALQYHLPILETMATTHGLSEIPEINQSHFPRYGHVLFFYGYSLLGPVGANLLAWLAGLLASLTAASLAGLLHEDAAPWAAAIFYCSWIVTFTSSNVHVDLLPCFFDTMAVLLVMRTLHPRGRDEDEAGNEEGPEEGNEEGSSGRSSFFLAGLLLGCSIGTKWLPLYTTLALTLVIALHGCRQTGWKETLRRLFLLLAPAFVLMVPWCIRNALTTGNPFYPLFMGLFGHSAYQRFVGARMHEIVASYGAGRGLVDLLLQPLRATIFGRWGTPVYDAVISPLLLGLLPTLLVAWHGLGRGRRRNLIVALFVHAFVVHACWVAMNPLSRYLLMLFPVLAAMGAAGLCLLGHDAERPDLVMRLMQLLVVLTLVTATSRNLMTLLYRNPFPILLGQEDDESHRRRRQGLLVEMERFARNEVPEGARLYFLWCKRGFHTGHPFLPDFTGGGWAYLRHRLPDPSMHIAALRSRGYSHIVACPSTLRDWFQIVPPGSRRDPEVMKRLKEEVLAFEAFARTHLQKVYDNGFYQIWELPPTREETLRALPSDLDYPR